MKNYKYLLPLSLLTLPVLSGCNSNSLSTGDFEIKFTDAIPVAYINQTYDFSKVLTVESGINYSLDVQYFDNSTNKMESLPVSDYTFTPVSRNDLSVTVEAYNASYIKYRKTSIRVTVKGDEIDELLAIGASKYADSGISKDININPTYIKQGNSSIQVSYYGSNFYRWGATMIGPNNFRCLDYWSDHNWDNAILTFWVYNPTAYDFEFQLRVKETEGKGNVDIDWGNPINTPQFAKAGVWSQVFFSMNKIGINRPLYQSENMEYDDQLNIKVRWLGTPGSEENPVSYNWSMYVDGVDVVDHTQYPDVDTEKDFSDETYHSGLENLPIDGTETTGFGRSKTVYRSSPVRTVEYASKSSLKATFKDAVIGDANLKYSVIFSPEEQKLRDSTYPIPTFKKGTIKADFKFSDDIKDRGVTFVAVEKDGEGEWKINYIYDIQLTDLEDGWYRLFFDFAKVSSFATFGNAVRFGFSFPGVDDSNKKDATIYIDNVFYDKNGTGPAPEGKSRGDTILANTDYTHEFDKSYDASKTEIKFDIKISNDTDTSKKHFSVMMFDGQNWENYFGYYDLFMDTTSSEYAGISMETLEDGYVRVTIKSWLLTKGTSVKPASIQALFIRGEYTDAEGYIDYISIEEVDPVRGETFTAGTDYDYWFDSAISVSSNAVICIDIKSTNTSNKVCIDLMNEWGNDGTEFFGHYDLGIGNSYDGVTVEQLGDGYTRYSFTLKSLVKGAAASIPSSINHIYVVGKWTEASGYIDISTK